MHDPRSILGFPSWLNARDLGGHPTLDGGTTRWRSILRSDDPAQLSEAGLKSLAEVGVATVIDLRWADEVALSPNPFERSLEHVRYHNISLLAPTATQWVQRAGELQKEMWVCSVLTHSRSELKAVLETIAAAAPGPLLFHCVAGKDRTGTIAALLLALAAVVPDAIARDYALSSENLLDAYLDRYADLGREAVIEAVRCPPEGIYNMLAYLDRYGGVEGYLADIGLAAQEVVRLRGRLRD